MNEDAPTVAVSAKSRAPDYLLIPMLQCRAL